VPVRNVTEAVTRYRKAAVQGSASARYNFGFTLEGAFTFDRIKPSLDAFLEQSNYQKRAWLRRAQRLLPRCRGHAAQPRPA